MTARTPRPAAHVKHTRWALLKAPDRQNLRQLGTLGEVYRRKQRLYRAFLLYHQLRLLYDLDDAALARARLDAWLHWAARSKLAPVRQGRPHPCAPTATASSPPSASASPTAASRDSTAGCGSSATAASDFTPARH
jgi:hypothetical protein